MPNWIALLFSKSLAGHFRTCNTTENKLRQSFARWPKGGEVRKNALSQNTNGPFTIWKCFEPTFGLTPMSSECSGAKTDEMEIELRKSWLKHRKSNGPTRRSIRGSVARNARPVVRIATPNGISGRNHGIRWVDGEPMSLVTGPAKQIGKSRSPGIGNVNEKTGE